MNSPRWERLIASLLPCQGNWRSSQSAINCRQILIESIEFWHILIWGPCYHFPLSRLYLSWVKSSWAAVGLRLTLSPVGRSPPCWAAALICHHHFIARQPARFCTHTLLDCNRICHYLFINSKQQLLPIQCILLKPDMHSFVNFKSFSVFVSTSNHYHQVRNSAPAVMFSNKVMLWSHLSSSRNPTCLMYSTCAQI